MSYELVAADEGKTIKVRVSFTDGGDRLSRSTLVHHHEVHRSGLDVR